MRKALALRFLDALGVPVPAARYVRLFINGQFYGLYLLVEIVDKRFLQRRGMNENGHLFKADHWCERGARDSIDSISK